MTTLERVPAAIRAAVYVSENKIPGDIVECGVWRGRKFHGDRAHAPGIGRYFAHAVSV